MPTNYDPLTLEQIVEAKKAETEAQAAFEASLNPERVYSEAEEAAFTRWNEEWADYEDRVQVAIAAQLAMENQLATGATPTDDPITQAIEKAQSPQEVEDIMRLSQQLRRV